MTNIPIVVLAAGGSTRMGGADKLMQVVDGDPLIRRQVKLARAMTSGLVFVALPPPPHPRYDALHDLEAVLVPVETAAEGMNASLRTVFGLIPRKSDAAMLLLADLPDLTAADLEAVLRAYDEDDTPLIWRGATQDGEPGHPIVFDGALFDVFADLAGDGGGKQVVQQAGNRIRLVPLPGRNARRDLDTPEDWAAWRAENPDRSG